MSKSGDSSFGSDILSAAVGSAFDFLGNAGMAAINNNMSQSQAKYALNLQKRYNKWFIPFSLEQQNKYNLEYQSAYHTTRPKWDVAGLRAAGLNPLLAASGGFGSGSAGTLSASGQSVSPPTSFGGRFNSRFDPLTLQNLKLLHKQNESLRLDNEIKEDNLKTVKAENLVKRLRAEAESGILKPEYKGGLEGEGKRVEVYVPSEGFKALQKAIRDDYDLRSEKYVRETIDAVFRYGTDVLKLLPLYRRKEILDTITKTTKTAPNGKKSSVETLTTHSPHK